MRSFRDIFRGKDKNKETATIGEIGLPTNVVKGIHVSKDQLTGELVGLPKAWTRLLKATITDDEQAENPSAGEYRQDDSFHTNMQIDRDASFLYAEQRIKR
jgi:P21-Rho-binding domain